MKQTLQFVILFVIAIVFPLTGWAEEQGYAVLDTENGILTFKYGELPEGDNVFQIDNGAKWLGEYETVGYGIQYPQARKIKKVVFDQSFSKAGYTVDTSMPEPNVGTKRLIAITRQREGYDLERTDMSYDDKGRIVNLVYSNGTRTKVGNYKYDNDVISIVYDNSFKHEYHFVNGKVSTASMNLESEGVTGTRIFEYDASDQLRKFTIVTDGSTNNKYAKIEWDNGSPSNISYGSLNTSTNTEKEMYNATFTQNGMTAEPVTLALFGMCFGKPTFDISDDIYESIAFYPYIGKLPQQLIGQTNYSKSGKVSVYNYTYEKDSNDNITKVTITCDGKATVYTLEWEDSSTTPVTPPSTDITPAGTNDASVYSLRGQRLASPQKGINIIGGKKIIVR